MIRRESAFLLVTFTLASCSGSVKPHVSGNGRCELIMTQEIESSAGLAGEASWKGVEMGKGNVQAEQMAAFKVELDKLQQDFNNMGHDLCMDWANGALTNEQYNGAKACLRSTHKKLRILSLGLQSGTVDSQTFMSQLQLLVGEMDGCEPSGYTQVSTNVQAQSSQGSTCASDAQCVPPLYCILGGCRPLGDAGAGCAFDYDCKQPLACQGGVCSQAAAKSTVFGTPCSSDDNCEAPLYCILSHCYYLGNIGDGCQYDYDCNAPYVCSGGKCTQTAGSTALGTPCTGDAQCTPPLFCIQQTCRPLGNPGDTCSIDVDCFSPYICSNGFCAVAGQTGGATAPPPVPPASGTACASDNDCVKPEYCILSQCRPLQPEGGVCAMNQDCQAGHTCQQGACKKSTTGSACKDDADCNPPNYCIVGACRPLSAAGGVCNINADCQSGLQCIGGACSY